MFSQISMEAIWVNVYAPHQWAHCLFLRQYVALTIWARGNIEKKWPGIGWRSNILIIHHFRQISDQWPFVRPYDFWSHFQLQEPGSWWSLFGCFLCLSIFEYIVCCSCSCYVLFLFVCVFVFLVVLVAVTVAALVTKSHCLIMFYGTFLYLFMFLWVLYIMPVEGFADGLKPGE